MNKFLGVSAACLLAASGTAAASGADEGALDAAHIKHVLLISVDGFHALDLANYVNSHADSNLAALSRHGVTYTNDSTSSPSDSFPGLASLVTGGSPTTTGLWYDDTYNRALSPPAHDRRSRQSGRQLSRTDRHQRCLGRKRRYRSDAPRWRRGHQARNIWCAIRTNGCATILPHQYLRVNTIFEVVKKNGGLTAWTDKHPSYEWTNGPSGRASMISTARKSTRSRLLCRSSRDVHPYRIADPTPDDGWTNSFDDIKCYDQLHVQAVINQIDGYNHDRTRKVGVPALFGTNFQSVSVGEKLRWTRSADSPAATPTCSVPPDRRLPANSISSTSPSGRIVRELKSERLYDSTLIIVSRQTRPVADRCHPAARHRRRPAGRDHRIRRCLRYLRRRFAHLVDRSLVDARRGGESESSPRTSRPSASRRFSPGSRCAINSTVLAPIRVRRTSS